MNLIDSQDKSLEALKSFNSTIVTCRLYPPDAPQVAAAVDRGYTVLKQILRLAGPVSLFRQDDSSFISGKEIGQEVLDSFPNLVVYRQLRLLGLPQLIIGPEMDRFAFGQLLSVFNASAQKIREQGGGITYTTSLGLANYFPEKIAQPPQPSVSQESKLKNNERPVVKVRPALITCLLGIDERPGVVAELTEKMLLTDSAVSIISSAIALILNDIQQKKSIVTSPLFPKMLQKAEKMLNPDELATVSAGLAEKIVHTLKDSTFGVLLCQEYPDGLGSRLYDDQINLVSQDRFGRLFSILREQHNRAKLRGEKGEVEEQRIGKSFIKLRNSQKGRYFLSTEKAQNIIKEGEKARKKNRLELGIKELIQGRSILLKSDELVAHLPGVVKQMMRNKEDDGITILLQAFLDYCRDDKKIHSSTLLYNSFITICEIIVEREELKYVELVYDSLLDLAQKMNEPDSFTERTIILLQRLMQLCWRQGDFEKGDKILHFLYQLRNGPKQEAGEISKLVGKVQDKYIILADLPELLSKCFEHPKDEALSRRLIYQGPVVVRFLIDHLMKSENSDDRIKLIDLLTYSSASSAPVVLERLPEHMPWYGKRNLIKLLGDTGSSEDAEAVLSYLTHEDFRVQREAFLSLYKLGGKNRKQILLKGLEDSSELIKIDIVTALRKYGDEDVAQKLNELLEEREFYSEEIRNNLLQEILETLGRCSCAAALNYVQKFLLLRTQKSGRKIPDTVWDTAKKAEVFLEGDLKEIRKKHLHASQLRKNALKQVSKISASVELPRIITGTLEENTIRALLEKGKTEEAQEKLVFLIERVARSGNFTQAEKLRDWLVDVDFSGLKFIVQAAEIIDREKAMSVDVTHLEIWSELYELLSTEEFSNLFHSLKHRKFTNDEILVRQGALQPTLFFINSGKVKLFFQEKRDEVLIKTLSEGEIVGAGAFFDASVWTISAVSRGSSDVSILRFEDLQKWSEEFPAIETKLAEYCRQFERVQEFIDRTSKERRVHKRLTISGKILTMILDNRGRTTGVNPKGALRDISQGGIAYLLRISVQENVRQLLGRQVALELPYGNSPGEVISKKGEILALKKTFAVENDYSVHVRFIEPLTDEQLESIIVAARRESQL